MKKICFLVSLLLGSFILHAQELSLQQALQTAQENAYALRIAQRQLDVATLNNQWGEAGRYPTLSFNARSQNNYSNINNPTSFLNGAQILSGGITPSLDANWMVYNGGRIATTKRQLETQVQQASANKALSKEQVAQAVTLAYYNALIQRERLAVQKELLTYSQDKINYTKLRQEYGQAIDFDLLQVQDAYLNDSINVLLQKNSYHVALEQLMLAMQMETYNVETIQLTESLDYQLLHYPLDTLETQVLSQNCSLKNAKINEQLAQLQIELQQANRRPTFSVSASLSDQFTLTNLLSSPNPQIETGQFQNGSTFALGLNLNFAYTFYDGGKINRSIERATLQSDIAHLQTRQLQQQLRNQLRVAFTQYEDRRAVLSLTQQLVNNGKRNLDMAEARFKRGVLNYFDFRTIQINYIRSLTTQQDAFLNAKNTEIELLLLSGQLVE